MPRLSYDVISVADQFTNPLGDREVDLTHLQAPRIENLAITRDLFDTINLSDNDIRRLDNFPPLIRCKTLLMSNNRVEKVDPSLADALPNLETLILTNNEISELGDLDVLSTWRGKATGAMGAQLGKHSGLIRVSLVDNPVTKKQHYRHYVIHCCGKSLRFLDFDRVTDQERLEAQQLFTGKAGDRLFVELTSSKSTFVPGEGLEQKKSVKPLLGTIFRRGANL
jgi:U2 small nuclear ribonucleoprotein A'